jgi:histidinol-phosphate aminotransferase
VSIDVPEMMGFSLEKALRPNIKTLQPYRCARDDYSSGILLDANENSCGSCLNFSQQKDDLLSGLHRYPDPHQLALKQRMKEIYSEFYVEPEQMFIGNGSDEAIDLLFRVFCVPGRDKVLVCPPTYGMYGVTAKIHDVGLVDAPLDSEFQLNVPLILDKAKSNSVKLIFLCSPGNPTGTLLKKEDILKILDAGLEQAVVVVDEAYVDFTLNSGQTSALSLGLDNYPNLVVMRTLSKSFGLAGLRLGYAFGNKDIMKYINAVKAPYNISSVTESVALKALNKEGLNKMRQNVATVLEQRKILLKALLELPGTELRGGLDANFLLVKFKCASGDKTDSEYAYEIYKRLAEFKDKNVVVRYRGDNLGCDGCLRITVGTIEENEVLLVHLRKILK